MKIKISECIKNIKNGHIVKDIWVNINSNKLDSRYFRNEVDLYKLLACNDIIFYDKIDGIWTETVEYIKSSYIDIDTGEIWIETFSLIELDNLYKDYLDSMFTDSIYDVDTKLYLTVEPLDFEDIKKNGYREIIEMDYDVLSFDDFCNNNLANWIRTRKKL